MLSVHVKDMAMLRLEFEGATLKRRVGNSNIYMVLEYAKSTGVVCTLVRGGAKYQQMLVEAFAEHVLGVKASAHRIKSPTLDLSMLRTGFDEANDGAALALDEDWLRQKMRLALDIESRDGIDDLGNCVWRLGDVRRSPVVLARDLTRVLHEPTLLDRVRVAATSGRSPPGRATRGSPFGSGVEWLALEDRFTFYGGGIVLIGTPSPPAQPTVINPAMPVHGPFSADFKWATLPGIQATPIRFTDGQAKVLGALWSFKGEATTADRIMQRAGLYSMPCAAGALA